MSSLYTAKSLGRTWLPSPVRSSNRPRYGSWPQDPPKLRWLSSDSQRSKRWSKIHERFALLAGLVLLGIWLCTCSSSTLLPRTRFRAPSWPFVSSPTIDISDVVYVTYASDTENLCSSLMQFESLHRLGAQAQKLLIYPDVWDNYTSDINKQLLLLSERSYNASLYPVPSADQSISTVALVLNDRTYKRIIVLDLDSTILRSLDTLFFAEGMEQVVAGNRAILRFPSSSTSKESESADPQIDIPDIANGMKEAPAIPHVLSTGEFRQANHSSASTFWSARAALAEADLVHFSDKPPWKPLPSEERQRVTPICPPGQERCEDLEVWQGLYNDFRSRRTEICGAEFNRWEWVEAQDETNRRIIPLRDRVQGVGGNSGMV